MENMTPPFPFKSNDPLEDKENDLQCISQTSYSLNPLGHYMLPWHCRSERLMAVRQVLWPRPSVHDPFSAPHLQRKGECVLSALQSPTPLGRLKRWAVWGRLAPAGRALTRSKEWTSFKVGRRNRKLRACLKAVARGQGSRRQTAPQPPLYLLCSSSLYGGYHNSLQPPWMSQAGRCLRCRSVTSGQPSVVCWARQVYLGLLAATGFPGGEKLS